MGLLTAVDAALVSLGNDIHYLDSMRDLIYVMWAEFVSVQGPPPPPPPASGHRYLRVAETGQSGPSTFPTTAWTPVLNGSVFETSMLTFSILGDCSESTDMSWTVRWVAGSKSESHGNVITPERKKPKKYTESLLPIELCHQPHGSLQPCSR